MNLREVDQQSRLRPELGRAGRLLLRRHGEVASEALKPEGGLEGPDDLGLPTACAVLQKEVDGPAVRDAVVNYQVGFVRVDPDQAFGDRTVKIRQPDNFLIRKYKEN